ncbi:NAD(P)H-dependent oxidoreductase [Actibacterium ureilyticum]|uniref:NAD(P)H-dependent oxidoreductase n=1 Tax=Actibacterium ureilyticum TaxID=1590614 RepID=UPI000BAAEBED|nr:NAD(P)H-dependent oxidoreductase [Actibacterium ureilyticum]
MPKRILILNGHPAATSLSRSLAETYAQAARDAGHEVRITHLHDLNFDMDFEFGSYRQIKPLEAPLKQFQADLDWCAHFVLTTPMWWGGLPAKLKGLIDRSFLPGHAFNTRAIRMGMPTPMLTGRSARVVMTSDTPRWFLRLRYGDAILRQLRGQILGFVGLKPARITYFGGASEPKPGAVDKWLQEMARLGARGA